MREFEEIINEIDRIEKEAKNVIKNHNNKSFAQRLYAQINILKWTLEPANKKLKLIKESTIYSDNHDIICVKCLNDGRKPHRVLLNDAYLDITEDGIFPDYYCADCAYEICGDMKHLKESEIKRKKEAEEWIK